MIHDATPFLYTCPNRLRVSGDRLHVVSPRRNTHAIIRQTSCMHGLQWSLKIDAIASLVSLSRQCRMYSWPACTSSHSVCTDAFSASTSPRSHVGPLRGRIAVTSSMAVCCRYPSFHFLLSCMYSSLVTRLRMRRLGSSVGRSTYCTKSGTGSESTLSDIIGRRV